MTFHPCTKEGCTSGVYTWDDVPVREGVLCLHHKLQSMSLKELAQWVRAHLKEADK